jgi:ABC-type multidrug transport system ATPase subunit
VLAGVDPLLRESIWRYLRQVASQGVTVIITTHYIEEARHAGQCQPLLALALSPDWCVQTASG